MASPTVLLSNGVKMPQVGLGTWQSKDNDVKIATKEAIKAGYRLIDTAEAYQNEHVIGEAIKECIEEGIIKREDLFITTKYMPAHENVLDDMESALRESIKKLGTDYVDLYLIHAPCALSPDWKTPQNVTVEQLWTSFEQLYNQKLTRSIGVSNFSVEQIERVMKIAKVPIHNQQVELSIYWPQHELHEVCKKYNISITSYGTLGSPGRRDFVLPDGTKPFSDSHPNQLEDKNVLSLAKKHNKTPAQILLRYVMDRGIAVIPKSVNAKRVKENFDDTTLPENGILASKNCSVTIGFQLFDFSLTKDEIALLESSGHRFGTFILEFWSNHPEDPYKNVRQ